MDAKTLIPLVVNVSTMLLMASVAMQARWQDMRHVVRHSGLLGRGIVAVNVIVPLVAVLVCMALPIESSTKQAIVIMAVSPLAPLVPAKMLRIGVDASLAAGLYMVLILLAVPIVPATVALLSALFPADASISVSAVGTLVFTTVFVPMGIGLLIGSLSPKLARRLAPALALVGDIALLLFLAAVLYVAGGEILALFGNGAVLAIAVTVAAGLAAGHLLGGPEPAGRSALAFAAATRHPGIAAMIAAQNFGGNRRMTMAIFLFLLTSLVVSAIYYRWMRGRAAAGPS